ncbi:MAG: hypothetical protein JSW34_04215, partial [Candidatus Zixiibacteriota bacterium]
VLPFLEFQDWPEDTPHEPLFVEVRQETYALSFDMADDFILFNVTIKNIGEETIQDAFFGVQSRPAVGFEFFAP